MSFLSRIFDILRCKNPSSTIDGLAPQMTGGTFGTFDNDNVKAVRERAGTAGTYHLPIGTYDSKSTSGPPSMSLVRDPTNENPDPGSNDTAGNPTDPPYDRVPGTSTMRAFAKGMDKATKVNPDPPYDRVPGTETMKRALDQSVTPLKVRDVLKNAIGEEVKQGKFNLSFGNTSPKVVGEIISNEMNEEYGIHLVCQRAKKGLRIVPANETEFVRLLDDNQIGDEDPKSLEDFVRELLSVAPEPAH